MSIIHRQFLLWSRFLCSERKAHKLKNSLPSLSQIITNQQLITLKYTHTMLTNDHTHTQCSHTCTFSTHIYAYTCRIHMHTHTHFNRWVHCCYIVSCYSSTKPQTQCVYHFTVNGFCKDSVSIKDMLSPC